MHLCADIHSICHNVDIDVSFSIYRRFIVPMRNGELDSKGALASIIKAEGTIQSFKVSSLPFQPKNP